MKQILNYLFQHQTLSKAEAKAIFKDISLGKFNDTEVTAFITVFLMRQITLDEMLGFRDALLELVTPLNLGNDLLDIVGTGGDNKNTFNISTLAAFVIAGAGQKVAKQGNYAASSVSGSSTVLESLGYQFKTNEDDLKNDLEKSNFCFIHAPLFHPSLKHVAPMRKELGLRTFFNLLGPLVNPAQPKYNVIGVCNSEISRLYQYIIQKDNRETAIVHGLDGYDEISLTADTKIILNNTERVYSPHQLSSKSVKPNDIFGGNSPEEAKSIFESIINGNGTKEQNAVVITNAAIGLLTTNKFGDYKNCYEIAEESLLGLKAKQSLESLIHN